MAARRMLLIACGVVCLGVQFGHAQEQKRLPRVGVLFANPAAASRNVFTAFTEAMRELGLVDGKTVNIIVRYGDGSVDQVHAQAMELVREKVDVFVTSSGRPTEAAKRAAPDTPIVCAECGDLITSGFAKSLARPGGNITGMSIMSHELNQKRIQFLMEIVPKLRRVAILSSPEIAKTNAMQVTEIEQIGGKLGIQTRTFMNAGPGSFDELRSQLRSWRAEIGRAHV